LILKKTEEFIVNTYSWRDTEKYISRSKDGCVWRKDYIGDVGSRLSIDGIMTTEDKIMLLNVEHGIVTIGY